MLENFPFGRPCLSECDRRILLVEWACTVDSEYWSACSYCLISLSHDSCTSNLYGHNRFRVFVYKYLCAAFVGQVVEFRYFPLSLAHLSLKRSCTIVLVFMAINTHLFLCFCLLPFSLPISVAFIQLSIPSYSWIFFRIKRNHSFLFFVDALVFLNLTFVFIDVRMFFAFFFSNKKRVMKTFYSSFNILAIVSAPHTIVVATH